MERIFMKIRKSNIRSIKAAEKLPYVINANELYKSLYDEINEKEDTYHLFAIPKDLYTLYRLRQQDEEQQAKEA
jgi:hypothetical protein